MLARIRKAMENKDRGFTLVELLVVMIIIGILAAVAIPVFLNQQKKARDTATKSDVSTVGKEIASYFVDHQSGTVVVTYTAATAGARPKIVLTDAGGYTSGDIMLSDGTVQSTTPTAALNDSGAWCVSLSNAKGQDKDYKYSAAGGLEKGVCAAAVGP